MGLTRVLHNTNSRITGSADLWIQIEGLIENLVQRDQGDILLQKLTMKCETALCKSSIGRELVFFNLFPSIFHDLFIVLS